MTVQTKELIDLADTLEKNLKFDRESFDEAIREFLKEIHQAQRFINKDGAEFVRKVARELVANFKDEINSYLTLVVNQTENDLGKCGPLANVYDAVRVAGCNRIVNPLVSIADGDHSNRKSITLPYFDCLYLQNGFWSGLICCILLFLPMIIFSLKLSTLYQKSDPYPGPLVES